MHKDNWDDLRFVLAVADTGSVSAASRMLGVNHATVLRRVAAYEERQGRAIFDRTPQGYSVPPERQKLMDAVREVYVAIQTVEQVVKGEAAQVAGIVRITSTDTLCSSVLPLAVAAMTEQLPGVSVELHCTNAHLDLARLHADITVRPSQKLPEELIGTQAGVLRIAAYRPVGKDGALPWLGLRGALSRSQMAEWLNAQLTGEGSVTGADSFVVLRELVAAGVGQTLLPVVLAAGDPRLVPFDPGIAMPSVPLWVASHVDMARVPRLRRVRAWLTDYLSRQPVFTET